MAGRPKHAPPLSRADEAEAMEWLRAQLAKSQHDQRCWSSEELRATAFLRRALPKPSPSRVRAVEEMVRMEKALAEMGKLPGDVLTAEELAVLSAARRGVKG